MKTLLFSGMHLDSGDKTSVHMFSTLHMPSLRYLLNKYLSFKISQLKCIRSSVMVL